MKKFLTSSLLSGALAWACLSASQATELKALTQNLPPFSSLVDGKVVGFSNELLDLIVKESGNTLGSKELLAWARAYSIAQEQENAIVYTMARTPERETLFHWVGPISKRRIFLYKHSDRKDIALKSFDDARKYKIGVLRDSASAKDLVQRGFQIDKELDLALDDELNMKKFRARRFDLLVSMDFAAMYNGPKAGLATDELEPAFLLDDSLDYWYGLSLKSSPVIAKQLNTALEKIKKDGRYAALMKKYLPEAKRRAK